MNPIARERGNLMVYMVGAGRVEAVYSNWAQGSWQHTCCAVLKTPFDLAALKRCTSSVEMGAIEGDEDLQERLGEMAASQGADLSQFERLAREQGWLEALRAELREERALDWLVGEADVTESV